MKVKTNNLIGKNRGYVIVKGKSNFSSVRVVMNGLGHINGLSHIVNNFNENYD